MNKKQKKRLIRILIAAAIFVFGLLIGYIGWMPDPVRLAVFLVSYMVVGYDVVWKAARNIRNGQVFDENFLMSLATVAAFFVGEYPEAVAVMLFFQVGELFQSYAVDQSRKSIAKLMDIRPDHANLLRDGTVKMVNPEAVNVDDRIVIKAGERIPLDGVVTDGTTMIDTTALTGESVPRSAEPGDAVISGCINLSGTVTVRVTKEYGESTVAKILELVENASSRKANAENYITKFARYYTPAVVIAAVIIAILPPLVFPGRAFTEWIYRALSFLVVSCPCALVISVPLSFFGGIGGASKQGILVKGGNYLEALSGAEIVVFDKTGTLTMGNFAVTEILPAQRLVWQWEQGDVSKGNKEAEPRKAGNEKEKQSIKDGLIEKRDREQAKNLAALELLALAAAAEQDSSHPIAASIRAANDALGQENFLLYAGKKEHDLLVGEVSSVEERSGYGVKAVIGGKTIYAGNDKLMKQNGIFLPEKRELGTVVYVAHEKEYLGCIVIADEIKADAKAAISALKTAGIKKTVMLTGDRKKVGTAAAADLGLDEVHCELLPADKVEKVEALLKQTSPKGKLIFVGDGINDAPVLARADVGVAMGGLGSDAAIEAADIVIMTDEPSKLAKALRISAKTMRIVKENIWFALGIKGAVLVLTALGMSNMWEAVFADVGVAVIAILNSMRAMKTER